MSITHEGELIDTTPMAPKGGAMQAYQPPAATNVLDADPARFAVQVQQRGQNFDMLIQWLCSNLVLGVDMVQVHFVSKNKCRHGGPPDCTPSLEPHHWADPDLSKRGAERVCGLLGLTPDFEGVDSYKRASLKGVKIEHIILECRLYRGDQVMSHGSGATSLQEMYGDLNKAIKMAAKRAHIDAVKRCAGLSALATEFKRLMGPTTVDPEAAKRKAEEAQRRAQAQGASTRYNTGVILTHVPFGKNQGKPWREISNQALEWYVQNCTDKPDVVRAAADELSKRQSTANSSTRNQPPPGSPEFDDEIPY